ncbi:hypothetical protein QL285_077911 [Trifolium repens]|nr:hypothetical protein QL285_077911 [Trifolium repens]
MPYTRAVFNYVQFSVLQFFANQLLDQIQRLRIAPETKPEKKVKREYDPFSLIVYVPHPHSCPPNLTLALLSSTPTFIFFSPFSPPPFYHQPSLQPYCFIARGGISAELMETSHGCKLKWSTLLKRRTLEQRWEDVCSTCRDESEGDAVNVYMSFAKRDGINGRSYANGFFCLEDIIHIKDERIDA